MDLILGMNGPNSRKDESSNIPIREVGSPEDMWEKIMKEVELGRYAGPYENIPYRFYMQSPIGLVPKAGGKTRLIFRWFKFTLKPPYSIMHGKL